MNISAITAELESLGIAVSARIDECWKIGSLYDKLFPLLSEPLHKAFDLGGSGQEKLMSTRAELPYVVKIAGDPEYQQWEQGMQSLFEEYHASRFGLNGHFAMAESHLFWHESGAPVLVQEKLSNLTNRVSEKLENELEWLPDGWRSYAQIGQTVTGEWRIYDLDAGSSCDFYPETQWTEVMKTLTESYYTKVENNG